MVATDVDYVDAGDVKRLEVEVRDTAGALANAGAVTATVTRLADLSVATPSVTNPSTGVYRVDYPTTVGAQGLHLWRMAATGANASVHTDVFDVRDTSFASLVSLLAAKAHLNIPAATTTHDQELRWWLEAATQVAQFHPKYGVGGPVLPQAVDYEDHDGGRPIIHLNRTPVITLTSVAPIRAGGTAVAVADLDVNLKTGKLQYLDGRYFPYGPYRYSYRAGYAVTPPNVTVGALIIIKGAWELQRGAGAQSAFQGGTEWVETPGMGLHMARAKYFLDATPRVPGVA